MAAPERDMPFIKNLASSDRKLRTAALDSLHAFLTRSGPSAINPAAILRLWTGLFYAMWLCDRPAPQQRLAADLAGLLSALPSRGPSRTSTAIVTAWLRGFWATMAREWPRIDALRMDKFLLLVRRVLAESLSWMRRTRQLDGEERWDAERVDAMLALLAEWPLSAAEDPSSDSSVLGEANGLVPKTVPAGLKLHVLDIWVDEAEKVGLLGEAVEDGGEEDREDVDEVDGEGAGETRDARQLPRRKLDPQSQEYVILERINALVDRLCLETSSTAVRIRSRESLADGRLPWNQEKREDVTDGDAEADEDSWDGFED